ncbi:MAG: hypothetical protein ABFS03_08200 [Chloroflexota bacterium]
MRLRLTYVIQPEGGVAFQPFFKLILKIKKKSLSLVPPAPAGPPPVSGPSAAAELAPDVVAPVNFFGAAAFNSVSMKINGVEVQKRNGNPYLSYLGLWD